VEEMFGYDLLDVFRVDKAIPDGLGIDHDDRAVFALVKTSGFVGSNVVFETGVFDGVLEGGFKLFAAVGKAAGTDGGFIALVGTDEDVMVKFRQECGSLPGVGRMYYTQGFLRQ
jgi:hypothetical protein